MSTRKVFLSYSYEDDALCQELLQHLAPLRREGTIDTYSARRIDAGEDWRGQIDSKLETADLILLLVSASFVASDYCWDVETKRALERHEQGEARVIPIIVRPCDWHNAPFAKFQALPKDGDPVTKYPDRDGAWADVARGIRSALANLPTEARVLPEPRPARSTIAPPAPGSPETPAGTGDASRPEATDAGSAPTPAPPLRYKPTHDKPLLVGLLVDVSSSMATSIENAAGDSKTRLESLLESLEDLVEEARRLSEGPYEEVAPRVKLFAYGFGFGNLMSILLSSNTETVRDLLELPGEDTSTTSIDRLANQWPVYKENIAAQTSQMLGSTPMGEGLTIARDRIRRERDSSTYTSPAVLFLLSDGEPTDATAEEVLSLAAEIRESDVRIVSCYVTSDDLADSKRLYSAADPSWPGGARLMLECASALESNSPFGSYLREHHWLMEPKSRLFTQINQSEHLSDFIKLVLSPLQDTPGRSG